MAIRLLVIAVLLVEFVYWASHPDHAQAMMRSTYQWTQRHVQPTIDRYLDPRRTKDNDPAWTR